MNKLSFKYRQWKKAAKVCFIIAAILFVVKPFLGYSMFNSKHPPKADNIFVKVFSKRTPEFLDNNFNLFSVKKLVTDPVQPQFIPFVFFLTILFPCTFAVGLKKNKRFSGYLYLNRSPNIDQVVFNNKLVI